MSGFRQFEKCDVFPYGISRRGKGGVKNLFGHGVGMNIVEIIIGLEYIMVCSRLIDSFFYKVPELIMVFVPR